jgi:hypothetical protein
MTSNPFAIKQIPTDQYNALSYAFLQDIEYTLNQIESETSRNANKLLRQGILWGKVWDVQAGIQQSPALVQHFKQQPQHKETLTNILCAAAYRNHNQGPFPGYDTGSIQLYNAFLGKNKMHDTQLNQEEERTITQGAFWESLITRDNYLFNSLLASDAFHPDTKYFKKGEKLLQQQVVPELNFRMNNELNWISYGNFLRQVERSDLETPTKHALAQPFVERAEVFNREWTEEEDEPCYNEVTRLIHPQAQKYNHGNTIIL